MNKTVLDFPEVLDTEDADVLYTIRGTSDTRDKKYELEILGDTEAIAKSQEYYSELLLEIEEKYS